MANSAMISPHPPARPDSALPGRAQGGDHSATLRDRLAPGLAVRDTPLRRHNTPEAGEAAPSCVPAKEQTAGYE